MKFALLIALMTSFAQAGPNEDKGLKIAQDTESANNGFIGDEADMEMTLIDAHERSIVRRMSSKSKEVNNDGDKSIITFQWPADVKGTKMLTWSHKKSDDDQWLYLPALKRVKRISSSSKNGSFMGSEFSYEDLGSQEVEKYSHKWLKDDKVGERTVWVLERVPVDKDSGYSKLITYMDQEYMNPLKIEYFDRKGELLKTAIFSNYKKYGKVWRANRIDMSNHQTNKKSSIVWNDRKMGTSYSEND
ncbi:MAG: outer membrane lipoprotein-sorting protein, partial [Bdellovibrionales bacterium]|nr:outer membrane lipoprotein-sorting protein [Bdellovibrionales bacterium]